MKRIGRSFVIALLALTRSSGPQLGAVTALRQGRLGRQPSGPARVVAEHEQSPTGWAQQHNVHEHEGRSSNEPQKTATWKDEQWPVIKKTAANLGARLCFEDETGQGPRPPKGRTWGRRGHTPVVRVTAAGTKRVSMAALICTTSGHRPRLIYRIHLDRGPAKGRHKGFTETDSHA